MLVTVEENVTLVTRDDLCSSLSSKTIMAAMSDGKSDVNCGCFEPREEELVLVVCIDGPRGTCVPCGLLERNTCRMCFLASDDGRKEIFRSLRGCSSKGSTVLTCLK